MLFLVDPRADRLWLLALIAVAGAAFVVRERGQVDPFVDVRVLGGNVPLLLTYARALLAALVSYSFLHGFTQWLRGGRGLGADTAIWLVVGVAVVTGIPQGLGNLALQNTLYHQADPARIGATAGLLRTFSYLGAIGAWALTGVAFGARADTHGPHELAVGGRGLRRRRHARCASPATGRGSMGAWTRRSTRRSRPEPGSSPRWTRAAAARRRR